VFSKTLKKLKIKITHFLFGFQFGLYHVGRCPVKVVYTEKYGNVHQNVHFLKNTEFKTLEHLLKTL